MDLFLQMLQLQLQLLLLLAIGMLMQKLEIISPAVRKGMSSLLVNLILPCNIVNSFLSGITVTEELLFNCALAVGISLVIQLVAIYGSKLAFRRFPKEKANVMSYGMIVSNSSFIGIPVVDSIYGSLAVMYTSIFQIPIRITMWTSGLKLFTNVRGKEAVKKMLLHPCVIAVALGFVLMLTQPPLPAFVTGTVSSVSRCTSAVSMLVVGSILAEIDWKSLFSGSVIYFCLLRLAAFPLLVFAVLKLCGAPALLISLSTILTAMPTGSTAAILAEQYGCDAKFAAQTILVSTLLSVITIPLICLIL
ncbi:MAG: AEC family transporter [Oscillospiraceae bacterium]|nr:AEC family transporter [Oscillospiraceae bacterium]